MPRKSRKVLEIEQKLATRVERRKLKRRDRKLGREERQFSDDDKENVSEVWGSSMNTTVQTNVSEVAKQQIQTGPSSSSTPTPAEATKETRKSSEWGTLINEQETLPEDQPDQNTESEENAEKIHKEKQDEIDKMIQARNKKKTVREEFEEFVKEKEKRDKIKSDEIDKRIEEAKRKNAEMKAAREKKAEEARRALEESDSEEEDNEPETPNQTEPETPNQTEPETPNRTEPKTPNERKAKKSMSMMPPPSDERYSRSSRLETSSISVFHPPDYHSTPKTTPVSSQNNTASSSGGIPVPNFEETKIIKKGKKRKSDSPPEQPTSPPSQTNKTYDVSITCTIVY